MPNQINPEDLKVPHSGKAVLYLLLVVSLLTSRAAVAQEASVQPTPTRQDTLNGSVTEERAWWDVQKYEIAIRPNIEAQTLIGENKITYQRLSGTKSRMMQLDLMRPLSIDSVVLYGRRLALSSSGNTWYAEVVGEKKSKYNELTVYYSGRPTVSKNPPWDGGMVWAKDSLGRPWISVACQYKGAAIWFPCKNSMHDEPDQGMSISLTVKKVLGYYYYGSKRNEFFAKIQFLSEKYFLHLKISKFAFRLLKVVY